MTWMSEAVADPNVQTLTVWGVATHDRLVPVEGGRLRRLAIRLGLTSRFRTETRRYWQMDYVNHVMSDQHNVPPDPCMMVVYHLGGDRYDVRRYRPGETPPPAPELPEA